MNNEIDQTSNDKVLIRKESNIKDSFILVGMLIMAVASLYWFGLAQYARSTKDYEVYDTFENLSHAINFVTAASPIITALGVRNVKYKMIVLIAGIVICAIRLFWLYRAIFPSDDF